MLTINGGHFEQVLHYMGSKRRVLMILITFFINGRAPMLTYTMSLSYLASRIELKRYIDVELFRSIFLIFL